MKYFQPLDKPDDPNAPYVNGNEVTGEPGSYADGRGFEATQREIVNAIIAAGLTPSASDNTQLMQAIKELAATLVDYQTIYQRLKMVENGVLYAEDKTVIGWAEIAADTTFSFDMSLTTKDGITDIITFELYVNMPTPVGIVWPENIDWGKDEEAPDMSEAGLYLLTFRYICKIDRWQASPQMTFQPYLPPEPETPIAPETPTQE